MHPNFSVSKLQGGPALVFKKRYRVDTMQFLTSFISCQKSSRSHGFWFRDLSFLFLIGPLWSCPLGAQGWITFLY